MFHFWTDYLGDIYFSSPHGCGRVPYPKSNRGGEKEITFQMNGVRYEAVIMENSITYFYMDKNNQRRKPIITFLNFDTKAKQKYQEHQVRKLATILNKRYYRREDGFYLKINKASIKFEDLVQQFKDIDII